MRLFRISGKCAHGQPSISRSDGPIPHRRKILFETMEPRLLLTADPVVAYSGNDIDVTFDGSDTPVLFSIDANAGPGGGLAVTAGDGSFSTVLIPVPAGKLTLHTGFGTAPTRLRARLSGRCFINHLGASLERPSSNAALRII